MAGTKRTCPSRCRPRSSNGAPSWRLTWSTSRSLWRRWTRRSGNGRIFEQLARFLIRAESVASSRIEGLRVGSRRLARHEASIAHGFASKDETADAVLGSIQAMRLAIDDVATAASVTTPTTFWRCIRRSWTGHRAPSLAVRCATGRTGSVATSSIPAARNSSPHHGIRGAAAGRLMRIHQPR